MPPAARIGSAVKTMNTVTGQRNIAPSFSFNPVRSGEYNHLAYRVKSIRRVTLLDPAMIRSI